MVNYWAMPIKVEIVDLSKLYYKYVYVAGSLLHLHNKLKYLNTKMYHTIFVCVFCI